MEESNQPNTEQVSPEKSAGKNGLATASLTLGIIGILLFPTIILSLVGLVIGIFALRKLSCKTRAVWGLSLSVLGLLIGFYFWYIIFNVGIAFLDDPFSFIVPAEPQQNSVIGNESEAEGNTIAVSKCVDSSGKDIYDDPKSFRLIIENTDTCDEAVAMANVCAWGSNIDISTFSIASDVCQKELETYNPSEGILTQLENEKVKCDEDLKIYPEPGSLDRSINAFCHLKAIQDAVESVKK